MSELHKVILLLLEKEVECLRSVLSEFDGDKHEFTEMVRADKFRDVIEDLKTTQKGSNDD